MAEGTDGIQTADAVDGIDAGVADDHWSQDYEEITSNPDLLKFCQKFKIIPAMAKSGHDLEVKLGSSYRLPDDLTKLTAEQKAEVLGRLREIRNVPDSSDGYEIDRPEMPDGMPYNEALETSFRVFAHERGWDNKDVNELAQFFNQAVISGHEKLQEQKVKDENAALQDFKIKCGASYDATIENIRRVRMMAATEMGLTYTNDKGELCSKLDDCLDATGLGNKVPIMQFLNWIHDKFLGEGIAIEGSGPEPGADEGFFSYKKVDKGKG